MAPLRSLLLLSGLGGVLLWGTMLVNGTMGGVFLATEQGQFPDGRTLRKVYTGYAAIDDSMVVGVAFFDLLTTVRTSDAPRWLFYDLGHVIAAINTWVLIESRRRGVRNFFLRHTIIFIFLWNMAGAAMVTPIYFYLIAKSNHTTRDATIPLNEARGLPPTLIANALFPLLMYVPTWLGWPPHAHQGLISVFNLTPAIMVMVVVIFSRPGTTLTQLATPKTQTAPDEDAPWVVASLVATGVLSAAVHIYIVLMSLFAPSEGGTDLDLSRLFMPDPWKIFAVRQHEGSTAAMVEGAHLFTQFDWIIVSAACVLFTSHLLEKSSHGLNKKGSKGEMAWNVVGTALLGPAAAGSFVLAVREHRLRMKPESPIEES